MTRPGAQGRRDAVRDAREALRVFTAGGPFYVFTPEQRAHRSMRRKLVAAMRRAVAEVVASERKAGR